MISMLIVTVYVRIYEQNLEELQIGVIIGISAVFAIVNTALWRY